MAKSKSGNAATKARDAATERKIVEMAEGVAKKALGGREPIVAIPTRARSNTIWNKKQEIGRAHV